MAAYDLADRFRTAAPPVLLTGVQAIARFLVEQRAADLRRGTDTAFFVSGYQGSPLGGLDKLLLGMPQMLQDNAIHLQPALNEEIAATSVWGSQAHLPGTNPRHDGVVGVWYGKAPGVDRATDALRHLTTYGTNPTGGVVLLAGDDPAAKSSTVPAVSERTLAALGIPVLFPRTATDVVILGQHAVALSRASGLPVALKIVADVADGAWVVNGDEVRVDPVVPEMSWDGRPWVYRMAAPAVGSAAIVAVEADLVGPRTAMIGAYAARNGLDVVTIASPSPRVGIIAAGPAHDSALQALVDLGVDESVLYAHGVTVLRLALISPIDASTVRNFARGLTQLVIVEDKTAFIESQVKSALYGLRDAPRILGKVDAHGIPLIPAEGELTPGRLHAPMRRIFGDLLPLTPAAREREVLPLLPVSRLPYFCSGCPHNRSTAVPEGSLAAGGIGCHTLVVMSRREDSAVTGFTQMGGEGAQWIGQAPFTDTPHIFQNIGDGTFFHSGQLAIQASVAAGVNITYKLLHNEVVAMTGAQDAQGALSIPAITHKLAAEGVARIIVVAEEPERHNPRDLASGTVLWHRDRLGEAQGQLRDVPGVTVLIYDQHCAADARRQRKRGGLAPRPTRVVINEDVCEGCGDCGVKSNCLSVQPVLTELGEKTRIDQSTCNTDYSCLLGDCPAFLTVEVPDLSDAAVARLPAPPPVPAPPTHPVTATQNILLTGVGGTGIVTVNQLLATAAVIAGYDAELLDQIGLSQKAGQVVGHLRFGPRGALEPSNRLTPGGADTILAFDLLTAAEPANLAYGDPRRTVAVAATSVTPTGAEVYDRSIHQPSPGDLLARLATATAEIVTVDLLAGTAALLGSSVAANSMLVGMAVQCGALRLPPDAIAAAIEVNGVDVRHNLAAFAWGRVAVADPEAFAAATTPAAGPWPGSELTQSAGEVVPALARAAFGGETRRLAESRAVDLVGYQDLATATAYVDLVDAVWTAERAVTDQTRLSEAVARYLYKLTAYKDEYEVARLLTRTGSDRFAEAAVQGGEQLTYRLHPPMLRALGLKGKVGFGPATHRALKALAPLKSVRGRAIDPFGRARVRRVERELVRHYRAVLTDLIAALTPETYDRAAAFAILPDQIRGYEDIKLASVDRYVTALAALDLPGPNFPA